MSLQASGAISLANVNTELGVASTTTRSMNDAALRTLFGVGSGAISMSNGYGKSNRAVINITISANTQNYVLNTAKATGYVPGTSDVTLTINSGIYVGSSTTGGIALDVDTSWAAGDTVTIVNNGRITGAGGAGGTGANYPYQYASTAGSPGGAALRVQRAASITNSGVIGGGGGGGGGGGSVSGFATSAPLGGAGGVGGSSGSGAAGGTSIDGVGGGSGGGDGVAGGTGTAGGSSCSGGGGGGGVGATGGAGGTSYAGGNFTQNGAGGGSAGACTTSGSNANITWVSTGTRYGTIG